jgi:hypothetical protein
MASKTSSPRKRASPTAAAQTEDAASMTVHSSEGDLWPGASRSDVGRSHGTDLLQSVKRWETEVAPTSLPDSDVRGWEWMRRIREPGNPKSGKFMCAATVQFWTVWVLSLDWGRKPVVNYETKHLDTLALVQDLSRTMNRSKYDSAEGWAARIEWLSLAPGLGLPHIGSVDVEIARLIGRLDVLREKANATLERANANIERARRGGIASAKKRTAKKSKDLGASYSEMREFGEQHNDTLKASGEVPLQKQTLVRKVIAKKFPMIQGLNYQSLVRRIWPKDANSLQVPNGAEKPRT